MSTITTAQPYHHGALRQAALAAAVARLRTGGALPPLRDLAADTGVTHRALYRHFADREALRAAVAGEGFALLADQMAGTPAPDPSSIMRAYLRFAFAEVHLYTLMFSLGSAVLMQEPAPGPQVRRVVEAAIAAFATGGPTAETRDRVISAWGMAHGLFELWRVGALTMADPDRAATFIMRRLRASGLI